MNSLISLRACNRILLSKITRNYGYKVIKRPDPRDLKMPYPGSAPSLIDILKEKMRLNGPMTVAEYMHIVITNPTEGYYMKKEVIGESGDFITSPEINQLFGEIIGVWFYAETQKMCSGKPLQIVELGPGNGTLLLDIIRMTSFGATHIIQDNFMPTFKVIKKYGYESQDLTLHLVELSSTMQDIQASRLCASHRPMEVDSPHYHEGETVSGIKVYWYNDLKKVPSNFSWFIAHEFFDVLPIHKFEKTDKGWREILIEVDETNKLQYRISAEETTAVKTLIRPPLDCSDRTELEISARGLGIARQLAQRVDEYGGIALIADYGHTGEKGDTFRAFKKHEVVNPLENPGASDLTADVDFSQLRIAASKTPGQDNYAIVLGPVEQKEFLKRMQAEVRLQILLENAKDEDVKEKLKASYEMLVDPSKMGERFKFMAFYPSSMAELIEKYPPLGFSTPNT